LNCGLVRDRGIDLTSITRSTPDSRNRSTNSAIVLVEWPMVKKVFVSSLQTRKAARRAGVAADSRLVIPKSKALVAG
jgi:hypothetical protein